MRCTYLQKRSVDGGLKVELLYFLAYYVGVLVSLSLSGFGSMGQW